VAVTTSLLARALAGRRAARVADPAARDQPAGPDGPALGAPTPGKAAS